MVNTRTELVAVVVAVTDDTPYVLASGVPPRLPAGPLADCQGSLQAGVRQFAAEQAGHQLGHVEQLYTFADAQRGQDAADRVISISYLGLTCAEVDQRWAPVYRHMPWEDARLPSGLQARERITVALSDWASSEASARRVREDRIGYLLGQHGQPWRLELALQRYEVLWEAGLIPESGGGHAQERAVFGDRMLRDHRRMLATALSRVRSIIQYRPILFELVPETFTLGQLQTVVEALGGTRVHTQNFRRLIVTQHELVEPTGGVDRSTGGRPARLYRFRRELISQRQHVGTKLPLPRTR